MNILTREETQNLLNNLPEPKIIWKYFLWCTEIPRPSHKLEKFDTAIQKLATRLNLEFKRDEIGNIVLKLPATKGYETEPVIGIQCHIDMVCEKTPETNHNFETDPIHPFIASDKKFLKAQGTTLGADDGIGVAACLALAEEQNTFKHGPLEFLLTVNEETDMSGAEYLAPAPFLSCRYMINVDSEEEGRICIGCAGGSETTLEMPIHRESITDDGGVVLKLSLGELTGGHTGIDIHKGRANSIKALVEILRGLGEDNNNNSNNNNSNNNNSDQKMEAKLISFEGGNLVNAIPRNSEASLFVPENKLEDIKTQLMNHFNQNVKQIYKKTDPNMTLNMTQKKHQQGEEIRVCTAKSYHNILDIMENIPHGVIRMIASDPSREPDVVETSNSLSRAELKEDHMFLHTFGRSSNDQQMRAFEQRIRDIGQEFSAKASDPLAAFPGWQPVFDSHILSRTKRSFDHVFGEEPEVYAVHAGLECGFIQAKYPDMECVSIGPQINGAHSPDECIDISSAGRFYSVLKKTVTADTSVSSSS